MTLEAPSPPLDTDATIYAFRRNVVVAASAGTGKTYRLTALYVLLALGLTSMGQPDAHTPAPPVGPERIVATTFSRAAAAEIAARVERALREIAGWDGQATLLFGPVIEARAAALGEALSVAEVKKRAGEALARWPSARIDTLHGVARRVVQRHAIAIGLAPGTRVLDEEEAQALADLAVDEALGDALSHGGERAVAARALIVSAGSVWSARQRVQRLIDRLDEEGLAPDDLELADHLTEAVALRNDLFLIARGLGSLGSPTFRDAAAALEAALRRAPQGVLLPADAVPSLVDLLTTRMPARSRRQPADDALDELIGNLPGKNKPEKAAGLVAVLEHAPGLREREAHVVALVSDARARLLSAKRRAGALGFGDLLRIARDTLRDRPEIARAVRDEIDVLLVDEFQDTSRVQRDLVYLLRERADAADPRAPRAVPGAADLLGHGLFLVGDRKQSIYGFRGADVAVFARIAAELCGRAATEALSLPGSAWADAPGVADFVALRESRRSGPAILSFVNAYAERDFSGGRAPDAPPRAFEIVYGAAEHLEPAEAAGGRAQQGRVVYFPDDGTSPEDADPIVRESSGAAREGHVAAAFVADLAGSVAFRDIAVLARRRSTIPLVELALSRLDIPYVVAGRALYDAPEVRDIAALLRLLLDPRDRLAAATVLRGPMVALSDTALALLSVPGHGLSVPVLGRWASAKTATPEPGDSQPPAGEPAGAVDPSLLPPAERARLDQFRARFAELRGAALRLPPGEAIRAAAAVFDLDRVIAALPRAEARIGNLDRLVTIARRRGGTLAAFVRWLERRMRDDADEAEAAVFSPEDDAVRLTTIHASKGLDFPVVVLVDLNAEPRGDGGSLGFVTDGTRAVLSMRHYAPRAGSRALAPVATSTLRAAQSETRAREQAERRRLTYVALTRARHTLALVGAAAAPRHGSALESLAAGLDEGDLAAYVTATEPAISLLARATKIPPPGTGAPAPALPCPSRPRQSPAREIAIDAAGLSLFRACTRRYRLRRLLGIEEPAGETQLDLFGAAPPDPIVDLPPPVADDPALDPRPVHLAPHRVLSRWPRGGFGGPVDPQEVMARLEAEGMPAGDAETERLARVLAGFLEGAYACAAREEGAAFVQGEPFVVAVEANGRTVRRLLLRGTCDLRVERPGHRIDVLVLSGARGGVDPGAEDLGLRAAALAAARGSPEAEVRAGLLPLGGGEIAWIRGGGPGGAILGEEHARFEVEMAALTHLFAEARYDDRFEGIAKPRCQRLGCGFIGACHGRATDEGPR